MASILELSTGTEDQIRTEATRQAQASEASLDAVTRQSEPLVLLTGFEPFAGFQSNPSQQVVECLDGATIGGALIIGQTLPVVFGEDTRRVLPLMDRLKPTLVLSLGLNAGRPCLDLERFAINLRRADEGDREIPIITDGPAAYLSTLEVDRVGPAVARAGVPVQPHAYAGNYLCNHILYHILHHAATHGMNCRAGFIHLPLSSEMVVAEGQMHRPSLPLEAIVTGVRAAIEEALLQ